MLPSTDPLSETEGLSVTAKRFLENVAEFSFKGCQAGVEQFAFRDDDDVEAWRELVATKNLSNQSFSSISLDRTAEFPGGGDSQPADRQAVREREQRQIAAVRPDTAIVNLLVLRAATDAFVRPERVHVGFRLGRLQADGSLKSRSQTTRLSAC